MFSMNYQLTDYSYGGLVSIAGLLRCGKSCRLRWTNYLRPDLKRGLLSETEEKMVIDLHAQLGNRFIFFIASSNISAISEITD